MNMEATQQPKIISQIIRSRWLLMGLFITAFLLLDIWEDLNSPDAILHLSELLLYVLVVLLALLLVTFFFQMLRKQNGYLRALDLKHHITLELADCDDLDTLANQMVRVPQRIAPLERSYLFIHNPLNANYEAVASWGAGQEEPPLPELPAACALCLARKGNGNRVFTACHSATGAAGASTRYCLPLVLGTQSLGFLQLHAAPGRSLNPEQAWLFGSIGDELTLALKGGLDRRVNREIHNAEISLSERRKVSYLLHDDLAQNIGYLRLKLEQMLDDRHQLDEEMAEKDLANMLDIANASFDAVRGLLETITPQSIPRFSNILHEMTRKTCQRTGLEEDFQVSGAPLELPTVIQQTLLYAFQEILSNVEKHARASRVQVRIVWQPSGLALSVADNGSGFDQTLVPTERHFGLGILHDRIQEVKGRLEIHSRAGEGTRVTIEVPLGSPRYRRMLP